MWNEDDKVNYYEIIGIVTGRYGFADDYYCFIAHEEVNDEE